MNGVEGERLRQELHVRDGASDVKLYPPQIHFLDHVRGKNADTEIGMSCSDSSRFVGMMITSSLRAPSCGASAPKVGDNVKALASNQKGTRA